MKRVNGMRDLVASPIIFASSKDPFHPPGLVFETNKDEDEMRGGVSRVQ